MKATPATTTPARAIHPALTVDEATVTMAEPTATRPASSTIPASPTASPTSSGRGRRGLRNIAEGEELFYSYDRVIDDEPRKVWARRYRCRCGAARCEKCWLPQLARRLRKLLAAKELDRRVLERRNRPSSAAAVCSKVLPQLPGLPGSGGVLASGRHRRLRRLGDLPWVDSFENASIIPHRHGTGQSPEHHGAELLRCLLCALPGFACRPSSLLLAPVLHRFLHRFHLEEDEVVRSLPVRHDAPCSPEGRCVVSSLSPWSWLPAQRGRHRDAPRRRSLPCRAALRCPGGGRAERRAYGPPLAIDRRVGALHLRWPGNRFHQRRHRGGLGRFRRPARDPGETRSCTGMATPPSPTPRGRPRPRARWRWWASSARARPLKNVILMCGDGMGLAHRTAGHRGPATEVSGGNGSTLAGHGAVPGQRPGHDPVTQHNRHRLLPGDGLLRHRQPFSTTTSRRVSSPRDRYPRRP